MSSLGAKGGGDHGRGAVAVDVDRLALCLMRRRRDHGQIAIVEQQAQQGVLTRSTVPV